MAQIIGLTGEKGGGKGTFAEILKEFLPGLEHIRFSDVLLGIAAELGIPKGEVSREQLQKLAPALEEIFGKGCITRGVKSRIQKSGDNTIVLDGIRWHSDLEMLRSLPNSTLVYITANPKVRFKRTKKRKEKSGEDKATLEKFLKEEQAETEKYIPEIGAQANYKIENNGSLEKFRRKVEVFYIFKTR
ncbi:MAG: AAA family ATPase [Candidatus Harrisonbacteria bacterium]|nr:AAA family ATPase [Candidatus Harrisonbacteria bacterium]